MSQRIRHLGYVTALCGVDRQPDIRPDLGYARYMRLGKSERFKGEEPYRVCGRCVAVIRKSENNFRRIMGKKPLK